MDTLKSFLDGFALGAPVAHGNLTMVPLLRTQARTTEDDYVILEEAIAAADAKVTEISHAGSVPEIAVKNDGDAFVFILDGEQLIGARQNRIVNLSILVPAKATLPIPVSCVERGRWSYRSREFVASPNAMFAAGRANKSRAVSDSMKFRGVRDGDQGNVWGDVDRLASAMSVHSVTGAMEDVYDASRAKMDDLLAGFAPQDGQVGAIFAIAGHVAGAELFETPALFRKYFRKVVNSYGPDAMLSRRKRKAFHSIDAQRFLDALREAPASRFDAVGAGEDYRIEAPDVAGGALVLDGRLIHLAVFRPAAFA